MYASKRDNFFKDYINIFAYYAKQNQKVAAINLLANGHSIFHGAIIVKNFAVYKSMHTGPDTPPDFNLVMTFFQDSIMDETRIITCF